MKIKGMKSAVITGVALACGVLSSHAVVIDFTTGYADGNLGSNGDWTEQTAGTYVVDATAGTVSAQFRTGAGNWQKAAYTGSGGTLTNNNYLMETTFRMTTATTAALAAVGGDAILNRSGYEGGRQAFVSMRQKSASDGTFDFWMWSSIATNTLNDSSANFSAADIGLAQDGSVWTDTESDLLKTVHKLEYNSVAGTWTQTAELWNLTGGAEATLLASLSTEFADDDPATSFLDADNNIRLDSGRLDRVPDVNYIYESISIDQIPEPATLGLIAMAGGGLLFVRRFLGM